MFDEDGVLVRENFIPEADLKYLNAELDEVFSQISVNGSSYCNLAHQRNSLECSTPALLMSVNIFEIIIDIVERFKTVSKKFEEEDFVLNTLEIQSHKNVPSAPWHTDTRGNLRAVIYLKGGEENSGLFSYMKGTAKEEYLVGRKETQKAEPGKGAGCHYWLTPEEINKFSDKIFKCSAPEGSLVMFDDAGFHEKKACIEERRAIWLAFMPRKDQGVIPRILLSSHNLTDKVMKNIHLFSNLEIAPENAGPHTFKSPKPLPLKYYFNGFYKSLIFSTLESIKNCLDCSPRLRTHLFNLRSTLKKLFSK